MTKNKTQETAREGLKEQTKGKVCSRCGGKLIVRKFEEQHGSQTSINHFPVCEPCSRIMYGTTKENWDITCKFVEDYRFTSRYHDHEATDEENLKKARDEASGIIFYLKKNLFDKALAKAKQEGREEGLEEGVLMSIKHFRKSDTTIEVINNLTGTKALVEIIKNKS